MTQFPESYGKALLAMGIDYRQAMQSRQLLLDNPLLWEALCNRLVKKEEKRRVIDRLFPYKIGNFLKYICDLDHCDSVIDILEAYQDCYLESKGIAKATLRYVFLPDDAQLEAIKRILCKQLQKDDILLVLQKDPSIIGGCVLTCGSFMYDKSVKGAMNALRRKLLWR